MTQRLVVLVRGVNVGGKNRLPMKDFAALLTDLGCSDVRTYVNSGNAVVTSTTGAAALGKAVEKALDETLTLPVRVVVRTAAQVAAVAQANPFPELADSPKLLHVLFVDDAPPRKAVEEALARLPEGTTDTFAPGTGCVYVAYTSGMQGSPLAKVLPKLAPHGTDRNWSTVLKLVELSG